MTTEAEAMQRRIALFNEYAPWIIVSPTGDFVVDVAGKMETFATRELAQARSVGWEPLIVRLRIEVGDDD